MGRQVSWRPHTRLGAGTQDEPECRRRRLAHSLRSAWGGATRHRVAKGCHEVVIVLGIITAACGDDAPRPDEHPAQPVLTQHSAADPAAGVSTELDGVAPGLGDGEIAELVGDDKAARAAYEQLLAPDSPPHVSARAALHLAQLEVRAGRSRHALDLVARASALAPGDVAISEGIAALEADVVAASGAGDIRGPRIGTTLPGVDAKVAAKFAAAERAYGGVHAMRPRLDIEVLSSSLSLLEGATEDVAEKYRAVADAGGLAAVAANYRIGSLYQDLAFSLLFEPPPELDPSAAAAWRRTLREQARIYLKKASASYRACLAVAAPHDTDAELWRLAGETDLRAVTDVLGESKT